MDPALFELIESTSEGEEVEIVARLRSPDRTPPGLHVVSRFGNIVTGRVVREELRPVWSHHDIASLKAPRTYYWDPRDDGPWQPVRTAGRRLRPGDRAQRTSDAASGQGVVVGVCDWGIDFAHDDFRNPDGSTRFLAIWNQSDRRGPAPEPFGYGRVYSRDDINHALASSSPYETLGYHPGVQDPLGRGTHGTHVTGIAAGNG